VPFVFLVASPIIAGAIHRAGVAPTAAHGRMLAERLAQAWKQATKLPLQFVGGDAGLAYAATFYLADRPSALVDSDPRLAPSIDPEKLARSGLALICPMADQGCIKTIEARAGAAGYRFEVGFARSYFGVTGRPATYLVIIVPPS